MTRPRTFIGGLDLGQTQDYTALTIVERVDPPPPEQPTDPPPICVATFRPMIPPASPIRPSERKYVLHHLERFTLGTSYVAIVERMVKLFADPSLSGSNLVVDATGVGKPVVDMLARARPKCKIRPVLITAGHAATQDGQGWHIPKKELVGVALTLLQGRRLLIPKSLPNAAILTKEFEMFRSKITISAHETFEAWRERDHDDLLLAVSLACWVGERGMLQFFFGHSGSVIRA
jgi:hypothetical protein